MKSTLIFYRNEKINESQLSSHFKYVDDLYVLTGTGVQ